MSKDPKNKKMMPITSAASGEGHSVVPDVYCFPVQIVNVYFIGDPNEPEEWVLVDAGMPESEQKILEEAEERFGKNNHPKAIVLTHGHFDHTGALVELAEKWRVPVYVHEKELPYVTGREKYMDPDPTVEGGMMAKISKMYPTEPVDISNHVQTLPADGTIPPLPGWEWIHTPGHTPGHISLYRPEDKTLIAGDAFVTVQQESLYKVIKQEKEISGPPRYLTPDWEEAEKSVKKLADLEPETASTGHGWPVRGEFLHEGLQDLAERFKELAVPKNDS
ncbi:MAG: MBL fold metallo-hydrolase [Alkalicoccus sp.]|nr:MAG: MBL fold metallo-hydrolase [Alkalicoccus sp.]